MNREAERKRLVEKLSYAPLDRFTVGDRYSIGTIQKIADHLLDNGIVVPPVKVGDVVYEIMDIESVHRQILEMKVLRIEIEETTTFFVKTLKKYLYNYGKVKIEDFGKTVFTSREDAVKALEGKEDEGK